MEERITAHSPGRLRDTSPIPPAAPSSAGQPSPGPRRGPGQAITIQHVGAQAGYDGSPEEKAAQHLRNHSRPHRGGDIIQKMTGIGQAAVGREGGLGTPAQVEANAKAQKCLQGWTGTCGLESTPSM